MDLDDLLDSAFDELAMPQEAEETPEARRKRIAELERTCNDGTRRVHFGRTPMVLAGEGLSGEDEATRLQLLEVAEKALREPAPRTRMGHSSAYNSFLSDGRSSAFRASGFEGSDEEKKEEKEEGEEEGERKPPSKSLNAFLFDSTFMKALAHSKTVDDNSIESLVDATMREEVRGRLLGSFSKYVLSAMKQEVRRNPDFEEERFTHLHTQLSK